MKKIIFFYAILSLGMASNANAILLGSGHLEDSSAIVPADDTEIFASLWFMDWLDIGGAVGFRETLSLLDENGDDDFDAVGNIYTYSSGTDFDKAVSFLTNGMDNAIWGLPQNSIFGGMGNNESVIFSGSSFLYNDIDFKESGITKIEWSIDDLFNINNQYFLSSSVSVYGNMNTVPTPSTILLLSIGLAGLGFGRHKKSRACIAS